MIYRWAYLSEHEESIRDMREAGMTVPQIANELGATQRHVSEFCTANRINSTYHKGPGNIGWEQAARIATANLARAIRERHPEKCAA